jgi:hypothetical protein
VRSSKYTRDVLAPIVASSRSLSEVIRRLGLPTNGGNHRMIAARVRQAELDTSHFGGAWRTKIASIPIETLARSSARARPSHKSSRSSRCRSTVDRKPS